MSMASEKMEPIAALLTREFSLTDADDSRPTTPDFAALFADDAEANADYEWKLTPRTAYALWEPMSHSRTRSCAFSTNWLRLEVHPVLGTPTVRR